MTTIISYPIYIEPCRRHSHPLGLEILGRSGLRVSELAPRNDDVRRRTGAGAPISSESRRIFERFAEAGGNFIDTASNYTDGTSERFVGELVAGRSRPLRDRDEVHAVARSATIRTRAATTARAWCASLEQSLRRLGTDYVDLLWLHMRDDTTPIDEAIRALDDQVRLGKVLYVGISDSPAWVVAQANTLADLRGWSPFVALQIPYSAASRAPGARAAADGRGARAGSGRRGACSEPAS